MYIQKICCEQATNTECTTTILGQYYNVLNNNKDGKTNPHGNISKTRKQKITYIN